MNPIQCLNTFEISLYTKTKKTKKQKKKQNKTKQKSTKDLKMILVMGSYESSKNLLMQLL